MAVYLVGAFDIHDEAGYARYRAAVSEIREGRDGMQILSTDDRPLMLEGTQPANHLVVVKYASIEAFQRRYESPAYQEAKRFRIESADTRYLMLMRDPETIAASRRS